MMLASGKGLGRQDDIFIMQPLSCVSCYNAVVTDSHPEEVR